MKIFAIFLLFAIVGQCTYADNAHRMRSDIALRSVERIFSGRIKNALEKLKKDMKTGNKELNLPKLDPLDADYQEVVINENIIKGEGKFINCHIDGLSDFIVKNADYELFKSNLVIDLVWPNIKGNTLYDANFTVINKYPVYGAGNVSFEVQNLNIATKIKVSLDLSNKKISIVSFSDTKISLGKLKLEITGLFNDEELSQKISQTVTEKAPKILAELQGEITEKFNALMPSVSNKALTKFDLWKLINM